MADNKLKGWDEMSQESRDRMVAWLKEYNRFSYTDVDEETKAIVLMAIEQDQLEPFHEGSSLHCWDACYLIGTRHYRLFGAIGHEDVTVEEIHDSLPEKGPIHETYKG